MSEQDNRKVLTLQHPTTNDPEAWKAYWKAQGPYWRTEPEIDAERQKYLAERRSITPHVEKGIYSFKGIKLSRADVEWLLTTHENGRGPVEWSDEQQRERKGLDLRGADLRFADLSGLPLTCMIGGITTDEWRSITTEQYMIGRVHLEDTFLDEIHLEGAYLAGVFLNHSQLRRAHLENADLSWAHLERSILFETHLEGANLRGTYFDSATNLNEAILGNKQYGSVSLADAHWNGVNLSVVDWTSIRLLGDEQQVRQRKTFDGKMKDKVKQLNEYRSAVRANRQLTVALQSQGLNEEAAHFAYHAQKLQHMVFWLQKKFGQYIFSVFLDLLAGYGYRPGRSAIWYLVTIFGFALAYFAIGHLPFFPDAFVFSLTSFHGRGFFPGLGSENSLHNPLVIMAAFEAVVGLLIEISFIATFTQRFFGR